MSTLRCNNPGCDEPLNEDGVCPECSVRQIEKEEKMDKEARERLDEITSKFGNMFIGFGDGKNLYYNGQENEH